MHTPSHPPLPYTVPLTSTPLSNMSLIRRFDLQIRSLKCPCFCSLLYVHNNSTQKNIQLKSVYYDIYKSEYPITSFSTIDIEYNKRLDRQRPCLEGDFNGGSNNIVQSNKSV